MNILTEYFVAGRNIDQIVKLGVLEVDVRTALREGGVVISGDEVEDPAMTAVRALGYQSFEAFIRDHQLRSLLDQARKLEVPRHVLSKVYDAYRQFVVAQHPNG